MFTLSSSRTTRISTCTKLILDTEESKRRFRTQHWLPKEMSHHWTNQSFLKVDPEETVIAAEEVKAKISELNKIRLLSKLEVSSKTMTFSATSISKKSVTKCKSMAAKKRLAS